MAAKKSMLRLRRLVKKKRLQAYGIDVDVVPEQCDLEHLGRALEQFYQ